MSVEFVMLGGYCVGGKREVDDVGAIDTVGAGVGGLQIPGTAVGINSIEIKSEKTFCKITLS